MTFLGIKSWRKYLAFAKWAAARLHQEYRQFALLPPGLSTAPGVRIISPQNLIVGDSVYIDFGSYLHCGGVDWCDGKGKITIGNGSYIGPQCILFGMGEIEIGNDVMIAPNVVISSVQHPYHDLTTAMYKQPRVFEKIVIESDVYIGSSVVITPGVRIGQGAVIGAGAVVTHDIEPYSIAVGIPAKTVDNRHNLAASELKG